MCRIHGRHEGTPEACYVRYTQILQTLPQEGMQIAGPQLHQNHQHQRVWVSRVIHDLDDGVAALQSSETLRFSGRGMGVDRNKRGVSDHMCPKFVLLYVVEEMQILTKGIFHQLAL